MKKTGRPQAAPDPKHISWRLVRLKNTFVFTLERSRGIAMYDAISFSSLMRREYRFSKGTRLKERKAEKDRITDDSPEGSDHIGSDRYVLY